MTEKRFKLSKWCGMASHSCILDGDSGLMLQGEVVGLLNTLHQQNQHLQDICTRTEAEKEEYADKYNELQKNFKDLTKMASETSKRNVELWERIAELQTQLKQKQEEEQLYAQEILRLKKTNEQALQFKTLGGDY